MAIYKCKMCGGELSINDGNTIAECDYCGSTQTVPTAKDENIQGLFNRANTLRIKCEFDKAEKIYEKIIQTDMTQSEAYWGIILCKFGVEYVEDPSTFKRIPTCHRASLDSIIADDDYKSALNYSDSIQRNIYESEAIEIDRLQKEIIILSQKEEPYDVFICYKESDDTGKRTQDSVIANDIYYQLKQEGLNVFYAAITLEDKLGSAYEPCIFAALNSAKVMLVIGTKPEFFNAVWVKNEWSRFLKLAKKDRSKMLIPCYKDMDAYELPEEFAHLQAQNMSKIGFINDIVRGINKLVAKKETKQINITYQTTTNDSNSSSNQLMLDGGIMYVGEVFANIPHGQGTAQYPNGDIYEGEWDRGKRSGQGKITFKCGGEFLGEFHNDKIWNGSGVYYYSNDKYEGQFKNGKQHGFGKMLYSNGNIYEGQWQNGKRHGNGTLLWIKGGEFSGEFTNDNIWNGSGVKYYSNDKYEGPFENGMQHGSGKMLYSNGDIYEGQWQNGKRDGQGTLIWAKGGKFSGKFANDNIWNGSGVKYYSDDKYEGPFENGMQHGFGKMFYSNGDTYEGQWSNGKRHGECKIIYSSGAEWNGEFNDDKFWNGYGRYYYTDSYYDGPLAHGMRHGQGKITWNNGGEWNGEFNNNNQWNGNGIYYYIDSYFEGTIIDGKRCGQGKTTWLKGGEWNGEFLDDKHHNGYGRHYYTDGYYDGPLSYGMRHGQGKMTWNKGGEWNGEFRNNNFWNGSGLIRFTDGRQKECEWVNGREKGTGGCYIATCVYGSYDCPQVWVLRRYRDNVLDSTFLGRIFIRFYYSASPKLVKWFGNYTLFRNFFGKILNKIVFSLKTKGYEDTPYDDK